MLRVGAYTCPLALMASATRAMETMYAATRMSDPGRKESIHFSGSPVACKLQHLFFVLNKGVMAYWLHLTTEHMFCWKLLWNRADSAESVIVQQNVDL